MTNFHASDDPMLVDSEILLTWLSGTGDRIAIMVAREFHRRAASAESRALAAEAKVEGMEGLWARLNERVCIELSWGEIDNDPSECGWRVHRRSGGVNDREWDLVSTGETALEAVQAALSSPTGEEG